MIYNIIGLNKSNYLLHMTTLLTNQKAFVSIFWLILAANRIKMARASL